MANKSGGVSALITIGGKRQAKSWCPKSFTEMAVVQNVPHG